MIDYFEIAKRQGLKINLLEKELQEAQDKLHRRNLQIKDLKKQIQSNFQGNAELQARIDLLEEIVKMANLFDYYCEGCYEYHKGNRQAYLSRFPIS